MRGIIVAGGTGSRLHPLTIGVPKQLLPVYDKPMIYYPLSTLVLAGIQEILVLTSDEDRPAIERVLGDGGRFGVQISYALHVEEGGLARAFVEAEDFLAGEPAALALGDALFCGQGMGIQLSRFLDLEGAVGFGCWVKDPSAYGVVELGDDGDVLSLEERPVRPRSNFAVAGLYFYDATVVERAQSLQPSASGALEITELNRSYLDDGMLQVELLDRGTTWLDTTSFDDLAAAGDLIRTLQQRQGLLIGSPEEAAWRWGHLDDEELRHLAEPLLTSGYGRVLVDMMERERADRPV